jgi:hypothetical protein
MDLLDCCWQHLDLPGRRRPPDVRRIPATVKIQRHFLWTILVFAAPFAEAIAYGEERCSGVAVTEVRSLDKLPNPLRRLLPNSTSGLNGIADRGDRFNATDVVDDDLPMRRFSLAAVGTTCAVIAVEYGGRAHGFELTEYRLTGTGWNSIAHHAVFNEPKSVKDLLRDAG